jgi:hypothetical protein
MRQSRTPALLAMHPPDSTEWYDSADVRRWRHAVQIVVAILVELVHKWLWNKERRDHLINKTNIFRPDGGYKLYYLYGTWNEKVFPVLFSFS